MINKSIWILFLLIGLSGHVLTQPALINGYAVQHFTDENGLPQNSINDLLFDQNGYLWLASQVGLVRFQDELDNIKSGSQLGHKFIFDLSKRLNGTLSVESVEHPGTTVSLRIPAD